MFHYINDNDLTYLCLADSAFKLDLAYRYLEDIKEKFLHKFDHYTVTNAIDYALNNDF